MSDATPAPGEPGGLPFVAPCRSLATFEPVEWLRHGWQDMRRAPRQSLTFGAVVVLASWLVAAITLRWGSYFELLALITGFVLIAPVLAIGTYSISCQLERGLKPSLGRCLFEERRAVGNLAVYALMLMVVFLVWARAASAIHIFFPVGEHPTWKDYATFLGIGSAVGSIFALIVFSSAAFALPMMMDRRADAVTAAVTSVNAVLRNRPAMLVWAAMIALAVSPGFALLAMGRDRGAGWAAVMILLGITMPLIGHASWHGYRTTIDASAWPAHPETDAGVADA